MGHHRLSANAAIIDKDRILLIEFHDANGPHFNLPGGGLDLGENTIEGLRRECLEEACVEVEVGRLLLVWEYEPQRAALKYGPMAKIGVVYAATLKPGSIPRLPAKPDPNQTGVRWVALTDLATLTPPQLPPIFPDISKELLQALQSGNTINYVIGAR